MTQKNSKFIDDSKEDGHIMKLQIKGSKRDGTDGDYTNPFTISQTMKVRKLIFYMKP